MLNGDATSRNKTREKGVVVVVHGIKFTRSRRVNTTDFQYRIRGHLHGYCSGVYTFNFQSARRWRLTVAGAGPKLSMNRTEFLYSI